MITFLFSYFLGAARGSLLYCFHNAIYVWLHVTDINCVSSHVNASSFKKRRKNENLAYFGLTTLRRLNALHGARIDWQKENSLMMSYSLKNLPFNWIFTDEKATGLKELQES